MTQVSVTLKFFPGVADNTDIVITFDGTEAEVVGYFQVDSSLDPKAVQTIVATVKAPCCTDSLLPGKVATQVPTRNPKLETEIRKPRLGARETRTSRSKPEIRDPNPKPGTRNRNPRPKPQTETRNPRPKPET